LDRAASKQKTLNCDKPTTELLTK